MLGALVLRFLPVGLFLAASSVAAAVGSSEEPFCAAAHFRQAFHEELAPQFMRYDIDQMLFAPTPALVQDFVKPEGADPLAEIHARLLTVTPNHFYEHGKAQDLIPPASCTLGEGMSEPLTLILVPGIMTEFSDVVVYDEVVTPASSFRKSWEAMLANLPEALSTTKVYSYTAFAEVDVPVADLFMVGSIDDPEGRPLVRYAFLRSPTGSLESIGDLDSKVPAYKKRLALFFDLFARTSQGQAGVATPYYLAGYSQGANVVLHLISSLHSKEPALPWLHGLRGMVSLGGPLFGSELSDASQSEEELLGKIFREWKALTEALRDTYRSPLEIPAVVAHNTWAWLKAHGRIHALLLTHQAPHSAASREPLPRNPAIGLELWHVLARQAKALLHYSPQAGMHEYFGNIRRFKMVSQGFLTASSAMSKEARLRWWQEHTLPPHLRYFAVAGIMPGVYRADDPLMGSDWYGPETLDYPILRFGFYEIHRRNQLQLNDSQVALHQALFWPALHQHLNKAQAPYEAPHLAILGTHHWGLGIDGLLARGPSYQNPFPRRSFIKALGLTLRKM